MKVIKLQPRYLFLALTASLLAMSAACEDSSGLNTSGVSPTPTHPETPVDIPVVCWGRNVAAFSSSSAPPQSNDYAAIQATGLPNTQSWQTPECIDSPLAWSPYAPDGGEEYIVLNLGVPMRMSQIEIFENFGPGATQYVELYDSKSEEPGLQTIIPPELRGPGQPCSVLAVPLTKEDNELTDEPFDTIAVVLDTRDVPGFNAIDAVLAYGVIPSDQALPQNCEEL